MPNRYESITYAEDTQKLLADTQISQTEKETVNLLKHEFQKKAYAAVIEDLYKFNKINMATSDLANIYGVSPRQIQLMFKELGLKRERVNKANTSEVSVLTVSAEESSTVSDTNSAVSFSTYGIYKDIPERLREFLNYLSVIRGKSHNTIAGYKVDLSLFFRFIKLYRGLCPPDIPFDDISIADVGDDVIRSIKLPDLYSFLSYLENARSNSAYARARKVASLKSFFKYLYSKTRILYENPASDLETPKISKRNPIYLTLDESKTLLNSVDDEEKFSKRDFCIITLFLNCGLRLSELCGIDISRIKGDTLTIVGKGNKERTVYLNKVCLIAISDYLIERASMEIDEGHKDALFISAQKCRINKRMVELIVKKYIRLSGMDSTKYTPHKLRHTAATLMYKHGNVDIRSLQKILGHENISTTQIYTHVDDNRLREAVKSNPLNE